MSEQPEKSRRTPLKRKTGTYPQPTPQPDFPAQMTPIAPPLRQNTPLPPQPEEVVIVQQVNAGNNNGAKIFYFILWPFRKLAGVLLWLIRTIITAMIQSIVSFIMWTLILVLLASFVGTYGFALVDTNMDMLQALTLTFERILEFMTTLGGLREASEAIQSALPRLIL